MQKQIVVLCKKEKLESHYSPIRSRPKQYIPKQKKTECRRSSYLFNAALSGAEHVNDVAWDQHHGRQRHEPTNDLAPHWVHVLAQGQRRHLDGTEGKDSLQECTRLLQLAGLKVTFVLYLFLLTKILTLTLLTNHFPLTLSLSSLQLR